MGGRVNRISHDNGSDNKNEEVEGFHGWWVCGDAAWSRRMQFCSVGLRSINALIVVNGDGGL
jgi:hypothetical protein